MTTEPLTDAELAAIEERCAAATPGPWVALDSAGQDAAEKAWEAASPPKQPWEDKPWDHLRSDIHRADKLDDWHSCIIGEWFDYSQTYGGIMSTNEADATFIAAARTDVPRLLAEVRRLKAEPAFYEGDEYDDGDDTATGDPAPFALFSSDAGGTLLDHRRLPDGPPLANDDSLTITWDMTWKG